MTRSALVPAFALALAVSGILLGPVAARADDREILVTAHYRILGERAPNLSQIAGYLEISCEDFLRRFPGSRGPGGKMRVRLFPSGEAIAAVVDGMHRESFDGVYDPGRKELWLNARIADDAELFSVIRHEGFHQFVDFHYGGTFPTWLNEGLACYFDGSRLEGKRIRQGFVESRAVRTLVLDWKKPERPNVAWVIDADYDAFHNTGDEWLNYRVAWLLCTWLVEDAPNGTKLLNDFIAELSRDPTARFAPRLGDVEKVEQAMRTKLDVFMERWRQTGKGRFIPPPEP